MSKASRLIGWIVVIVVVVGVVWFANKKSAPQVEAKPKVKVGLLNIGALLPYFIAQDMKSFEQQGLDPEFVMFQSSNQLIDAMERGEIDTSEASLVVYFAAEQLAPGKLKVFAVTDITDQAPFDRIVVKKDSPIQNIKQLAGKKIGVFPGTTAMNLSKNYLKKQGIDVSKIDFVQLPPQNQLTALESKAIDALYAFEPGLTIATEQGARTLTPSIFADLVNHNPVGGLLLTTKFINEQPEAAKKVVTAIDQAIKLEETDPTKARAVAQAAFKLEPAVASKFSLSYFRDSKSLDKDIVAKFVDQLVAIGELKTKPDLSSIYYQP